MTALDEPAMALSARDRAILAAVGAGRAEMSCGPVPELFIDGLHLCDQSAAHRLLRWGLISGTGHGRSSRVPAELTELAGLMLSIANLGSGVWQK